MKNFIQENLKLISSFCLIAILFPIIILYPSPIGIIPPDIGLQIVGYGGSILGGFLTLYGVWWTIKEQKKDLKEQQDKIEQQRRDDLAIQYKPIIRFDANPFDNERENNGSITHDAKYTIKQENELNFFIFNTGRGEATNININITKYDNDILQKCLIKELSSKILVKEESMCIRMDCLFSNGYTPHKNTTLTFELQVSYVDLFGNNINSSCIIKYRIIKITSGTVKFKINKIDHYIYEHSFISDRKIS